MELSKAEERLMEVVWKMNTAYMKDLIENSASPKPAPTTIATLLKRMQDKGFIGYKMHGNSREYYPLVKKATYFSRHVKSIIKNYFNDSAIQFASFFTTSTNLSQEELEELKGIIEQEIAKGEK